MPGFTSSYSPGSELLPPNAYVLQVITCGEAVSTNGSDMFKLKLSVIPNGKWVWDYLVFHPKSIWVIQDFCRSSGLELPVQECDIDLQVSDCIHRVCYAEVGHERGNDGKIRLNVERYITRKEALELNPDLVEVALPRNTPAAKKLRPIGAGANASAPARKQSPATKNAEQAEVEPDDIPF